MIIYHKMRRILLTVAGVGTTIGLLCTGGALIVAKNDNDEQFIIRKILPFIYGSVSIYFGDVAFQELQMIYNSYQEKKKEEERKKERKHFLQSKLSKTNNDLLTKELGLLGLISDKELMLKEEKEIIDELNQIETL